MVLEDPLDDLMQYINGYQLIDVRTRKSTRKGLQCTSVQVAFNIMDIMVLLTVGIRRVNVPERLEALRTG